MTARRLGEILTEEFGVAPDAIEAALETQRAKGGRVGEILLKQKAITETLLIQALARQYDIPLLQRPPDDLDVSLAEKIPIQFVKQHHIIPLKRLNGSVLTVMHDPLDLEGIDDLGLVLESPLDLRLAEKERIVALINQIYDKLAASGRTMEGLKEDSLGIDAEALPEAEDLLDVTDEQPIIRLVNSLLYNAIKQRATDIHVEPFERDLVIRYRIDGILYNVLTPPKAAQPTITSRVKVMAGMNIAEKRLPQDGRIRLLIAGKDVDIRVSSVPTAFGERIVMRLLDKSLRLLHLEEIGLDGKELETVHKLIVRSNGIILVTGPTGSGKTTTLYGAISKINSPDKNIITVEDPIEYQIRGIGQIQVNPKIELTFASALRSILRQDPDVILVGEIRDVETAEIAIQASLTGHLVFSTLHTNDSPGALTRLIDMGTEPFLISSSLVAVLAQRLVRTICLSCKEPYEPSASQVVELGVSHSASGGVQFYRGKGCPECLFTGFRGRTGIFELLVVGPEIQEAIVQKTDANVIRRLARSRGMQTLREDGARRVLAGQTTVEEILRVTQEEVLELA
ncbi:MAG: type II secretion system ATPase GspE [Nitrospirae bacterium]|nr:type II secretion system ATPase GspE [Nitrospirota bacterium]